MPVTISDELIVGATILGPILAVQAQKWLEQATNKRRQKLSIFYTLMATRATRLAPDHVQALNRIDLEFSGSRFLGFIQQQTPKQRVVSEAWRSYHDLLSNNLSDKSREEIQLWGKECDRLFIEVLYSMSRALGFPYDRVLLMRGIYHPNAHSDLEHSQRGIQDNLLKVLAGQSSIKMDVVGFPFSQSAIDSQLGVQKSIMSAITPEGEIRITQRPIPKSEV